MLATRRDATARERDEIDEQLAAQREEHRQRGERLRHAAEAQRANMHAAGEAIRRSRSASREQVRSDMAQRASAAKSVAEQRSEHAWLTIAEVQWRTIADVNDALRPQRGLSPERQRAVSSR